MNIKHWHNTVVYTFATAASFLLVLLLCFSATAYGAQNPLSTSIDDARLKSVASVTSTMQGIERTNKAMDAELSNIKKYLKDCPKNKIDQVLGVYLYFC